MQVSAAGRSASWPPECKKRVGVETFGAYAGHFANLCIAQCPLGKGLLDSVASKCILSQVGKRVDHTPTRIVVAAVPVGISSQHRCDPLKYRGERAQAHDDRD